MVVRTSHPAAAGELPARQERRQGRATRADAGRVAPAAGATMPVRAARRGPNPATCTRPLAQRPATSIDKKLPEVYLELKRGLRTHHCEKGKPPQRYQVLRTANDAIGSEAVRLACQSGRDNPGQAGRYLWTGD